MNVSFFLWYKYKLPAWAIFNGVIRVEIQGEDADDDHSDRQNDGEQTAQTDGAAFLLFFVERHFWNKFMAVIKFNLEIFYAMRINNRDFISRFEMERKEKKLIKARMMTEQPK